MLKLNIGAGNFIMEGEGWRNHDMTKHRPEIDIVFDLNEFPYPLNDNMYDFIRMHDVMEHLNDTIAVMNELWRLLKPNCELEIKACGMNNPNRYKDVTHKTFFDTGSFDLFCPDTERGKELSYYTDKKWRIVSERLYRDNIFIKLITIK